MPSSVSAVLPRLTTVPSLPSLARNTCRRILRCETERLYSQEVLRLYQFLQNPNWFSNLPFPCVFPVHKNTGHSLSCSIIDDAAVFEMRAAPRLVGGEGSRQANCRASLHGAVLFGSISLCWLVGYAMAGRSIGSSTLIALLSIPAVVRYGGGGEK